MEALLQAEATALRSADFAALALLADRKEALLAQGLGAATAPDLERLQQLSRRNDALLRASRKGLEAALQSLKAAGEVGTLVTYDGSGRRQQHSGPAWRTDGRA